MAKEVKSEETPVVKESIGFYLPNKKIHIKPIIKKGKWLSEEHSGNFMYDNTTAIITIPISAQTGQLVDPLTREEREFFENKSISGMDFEPGDLNIYKKTNEKIGVYNYWALFEYRIHKNQGVLDDASILDTLNLSNPVDYLKYKVLLTNSLPGGTVSPSWEKRFDQGTYRLSMMDADVENDISANRADKLGKAWGYYSTIQNSRVKMHELISVYWLENRKAIKPEDDANIEWLKKEISKIINENLDGFINLIESNYEEKLLIHTALKCGALRLSGKTFMTADGTPLGDSLREAILYYRDERHNEAKLKLIAQIELANSKKGE
jgi:hypothetical protein